MNKHKQIFSASKIVLLNVKWLSNVSLFIAIAVDTSEMRFYKKKKTSICIRLYKIEDCCLPACLSVSFMNKTSTNSLIFYFDKAKQKNVCWGYMKNIAKYFVLLSRIH